MKKRKDTISTILMVLVFVAGLSLLLYPTVANWWNSKHASQTISRYNDAVQNLTKTDYKRMRAEAEAYNKQVYRRRNVYELKGKDLETYNRLLNIGGTGMIGVVEIPGIDVSLPIYHGTSEGVLQVAAGHLNWTSLPVGGKNTHAVISGHRGLPSAKLFTNLDKVVEGDVFMLRVLDEVLTYQVDQILIVEPKDVEPLQVVKGKDYCTLVTCTPYGINTHRMLVRGRRIESDKEAAVLRITSEAIQVEELLVASVLAVPLLIILLVAVFTFDSRKYKKPRRRK